MRVRKIYSGIRLGSGVEVTVLEQFEDQKYIPIGLLKHRVYHSPTGFEWGYLGSGPSDLARSILWDHLGKEPPRVLYMEFKEKFVSGWKDEWEINGCQIQDWIKKREVKIK